MREASTAFQRLLWIVAEQQADVDLDRVERLGPNVPLGPARDESDDVSVACPAVDRQRLVFRVHDPVVRHLALTERLHLLDEIAARRARREDFTDPVGLDAYRASARTCGRAFAAPAGNVRAVYVVGGKLDVRLREDPPATGTSGTSGAPLERPLDEQRDVRLRIGVLAGGSRLLDDDTPDDFPALIIRKPQEIVGRSQPVRVCGHGASIAPYEVLSRRRYRCGVSLQSPQDIAIGPDGSLYIADTSNQRIRRVDPAGVIHTVAGSGPTGATAGSFSGEGGPASLATLNNPTGVDITSDGRIYVADRDNGRIRQISPSGTIVTVAGTGPSTTSTGTGGAATAASLGTATKVRVGPDGSFCIAETTGNVVRRVGPEGIIHPMAGTGTAGFSGDGPAKSAMLNAPLDVAFGPGGNLYVVDQNNVVRQIAATGLITSVLGINGQSGFSGDSGLATAATIGTSRGLRVGPDGSIYVASYADNRVRIVQSAFNGFSATTNTFQFPSEDGRKVFVFDGNGRHQRTVDALTGAALDSFGYDTAGRLASATDFDGNVTRFNRDGAGNLTSLVTPYGQSWTFTADSNGYLASATDPASEVTRFTYDANGLMQTKTDPRGGLSQYSYDGAGRLTLDQDPAGGSTTLAQSGSSPGSGVTMTSALGVQTNLATSVSFNGDFDRLNALPGGAASLYTRGPTSTTVSAPDGSQSTTTQAPDPRIGFGMLAPTQSVTTTLPSGLSSTQSTTRAVTSSGSNLATFTEQTNLNGNTWTRLFNAATRTWTTTSPAGRSSTMTVDAAGRPTQIAVRNVAPISIGYDSHGRLASTTQSSHTSTLTYDPNGYQASFADALSHTMSFTNDAVGRPTLSVLPDNRQIGTTYDGAGNATRLVVPSTEPHAFSFTPVNLLASYTPPSLSSSSPATLYSYDVDRKLTTVTRPDGVTLTYGYDPTTGRRTSIAYPQGTLSFAYDASTGNLQSTTSPSGEVTTFAYDGALQTGTTWSNGPVAGTLSLGFDNNFRMTSQTVNGTALAFGYDLDGLLSGAGALTLTLDAQNGRLTGTTLGSMTDTDSYDANGLFASYTAKYSGTTVYSESVIRDAVGRITQKTETVQGTTHVWGYTFDPAGRLTDVTKDGSFFSHYGYDADDNRTTYQNTGGTVHPVYDAQDRLTTYGSATYGYTDNGELTSKTVGSQVTNYTYDALGNLLHVAPPSVPAIDYVVDGENRRVGKELGGTLSQGFLYQDALNVVAQLDGSGNLVARYVFGTRRNVPDYYTTSAGTFRIVSDHLGSPRLVVNTSSGAVLEQIDYDEFGVVTNDTSPGLTPFGFAGGLYDKDTGLVRFGARDYDASVGRWTRKDPIRFRGGMNLYRYVNNDPVNGKDSTGLTEGDCDFFCGLVTNTICTGVGAGVGLATAPETLGAGLVLAAAVSTDCYLSSYVACTEICHPPPPPLSPPPGPTSCRPPGPPPPPCDPSTTSCL